MFPRGIPEISAKDHFILKTPIDWTIDTLTTSQNPFLGYIHLLPPHAPYTTRMDFIDAFKDDGFAPVEKPFHPMGQKPQTYQKQAESRRFYDE